MRFKDSLRQRKVNLAENPNSDGSSSQSVLSGEDYYRDGKYLRMKHQLAGAAGEQFVKWVLALVSSWKTASILDAGGGDLFATCFRQVTPFYFQDEELIYDAAGFRASYETIGRYRNLLSREDIPEKAKHELPHIVEQLAQEAIEREGVLRAPRLMGAFVCTDPVLPEISIYNFRQ
jgi:hypothetical protein